MDKILQHSIPAEMSGPVRLPGMALCGAQDWLRVDEAYGAQLAYRAALLRAKRDQILYLHDSALDSAIEVLDEVLSVLPALGFSRDGAWVICPDRRRVLIDRTHPLDTLCALVQEDICILQKQGDQHVLTGALVCFPASWQLADKAGQPLGAIHDPVALYDGDLARRVQRLFDGVQVGRPMWRFNRLAYAKADLHQPRRANDDGQGPFTRSERQCILRLPKTDAVVFTIHTYVVETEEGQTGI